MKNEKLLLFQRRHRYILIGKGNDQYTVAK